LVRPSSIGRPFLTDLMRIVDADNRSVKAFETGHLSGITDSSFPGYDTQGSQDDRADYEVISGDQDYKDEDGYFYLDSDSGEKSSDVSLPNSVSK